MVFHPQETDFRPDAENTQMLWALQLVNETKQSFFLTGKAGTGKSTLMRHIRQTTNKKCVMLAPTGIAALHIGGQTLHRFFKLPFRPLPPNDPQLQGHNLFDTFKYNKEHIELIRSLELIIVDEVSMVRADLVDVIDRILRAYRRMPNEPFGGVQMLFVGDLYQLEPVVTTDERDILRRFYPNDFFFSATIFRQTPLLTIELEKVYRQADGEFVKMLDRFRLGIPNREDFQVINQRVGIDEKNIFDAQELSIRIGTTRSLVDEYNTTQLRKLPTDSYCFMGKITGDFPDKELPTELHLNLKVGAQVMFLSNHPLGYWANSSLGIVEQIDEETEVVSVRLENGDVHPVEPFVWENMRYSYDAEAHKVKQEVIGQFFQLPLRLAWAITIHKSQGLTFNRVSIDFGSYVFAPGLAYVALSRCRSIEGIRLVRALRAHEISSRQTVREFYSHANSPELVSAAMDRSKAEQEYLSALSAWRKHRFAEAVNHLNNALTLSNELSRPHYRRMLTSQIYRMVQGQQEQLKKQRTIINKQSALLKEMAEEYVALGEDCIHLYGEYEAALRNFDKSLKLMPKQTRAIIEKSRAYLLMEQYEQALREARKAVQLDPLSVAALSIIGETQLKLHRPEDAEEPLLKAFAQEPNLKTIDLLIRVYEEQDKEELAARFRLLRSKHSK